MKRLLIAMTVVLGAAALVTPVRAQTPPEPPAWPAGGVAQVFVSAHTLTAANAAYTPAVVGKQENFFPQTSAVRFQVYAVDLKTSKVVTAKDARYFYVSIPNQPNVKLTYGKAGTGAKAPYVWTGTWTISETYPLGVVPFKVVLTTKSGRHGIFQQAPVAAAQLTVIAKP
jgi:hypothetical protein